jgi:competence protein ComEC
LLVDGGTSPARLADQLGARLPPWQRTLEALVITGPGIGHVGGLAGLTYAAGTVLVPDGNPAGSAWRTVALAEAARGAVIRPMHAGQRWWFGGLRLDVLSPEPGAAEAGQVALRVTGPGGGSFCDLADLDPDGQALAATRLTGICDAVLVPNGGRSAPAPDFVSAARPRQYVVSDTGGQLARGLPPGRLARTSQEGAIVVSL